MIKKPNELDFSQKNYIILIAGRPGVGKTTLALSAPKPLLIDIEEGVDRVEACYRSDTLIATDYHELVNDLKSKEIEKYDTLIVDTLGALIDMMKPVVIKESPLNSQKDGKTLSLKGYGAIKVKIKEFFDLCKSLKKHLILIAHVSEFNDGDVVKTRLNIEGSTKDSVWDFVDLGGFLQFVGKERHIYFSPTEKWDAKGTHGITGDYEVPVLRQFKEGGNTADNHFMTDLFNVLTQNIVNEQSEFENENKNYEDAMKIAPEIAEAATIDALNEAVEKIKKTKHGLTSREELLSKVTKKAEELGAVYDKATKRYIPASQN